MGDLRNGDFGLTPLNVALGKTQIGRDKTVKKRERFSDFESVVAAREKSPHPNPLPTKLGRGDKMVTTRERFSYSEPVVDAREKSKPPPKMIRM